MSCPLTASINSVKKRRLKRLLSFRIVEATPRNATRRLLAVKGAPGVQVAFSCVRPERATERIFHQGPPIRSTCALSRGVVPTFFHPRAKRDACLATQCSMHSTGWGYHGRATRDWIERQLAHVERNEVRRAYNAAEWMPDRRRMMQWWADHITTMTPEGDNILPLSRASQIRTRGPARRMTRWC